jgi:hypothetical protein
LEPVSEEEDAGFFVESFLALLVLDGCASFSFSMGERTCTRRRSRNLDPVKISELEVNGMGFADSSSLLLVLDGRFGDVAIFERRFEVELDKPNSNFTDEGVGFRSFLRTFL